MPIITGNFKIDTHDAEEKKVFRAMKIFFKDHFQNYEFNVSGKNETLRDDYHKPKEVEEPKEVKKYSASQILNQEQLVEEVKEKVADEVDKSIIEELEKNKVVLG